MQLVINGKFVESQTNEWINNYNPATNEVISRVPCATQEEMTAAIKAAEDAFPEWKEKSVLTRQQIMFKFRDLIKKHWVNFIVDFPCTTAYLIYQNLDYRTFFSG